MCVLGSRTLNEYDDDDDEGSHYVRPVQGIFIVSDVITSLMWEAFWLWVSQHGFQINDDVMACAIEVRKALFEKSRSQSIAKFSELLEKSDSIKQMFLAFREECETKSEVCQYWGVF